MENEIILKLNQYNLNIEPFKIKQINDEEDYEIIKRFNESLEKMKDIDDKLIDRLKNEKKKILDI